MNWATVAGPLRRSLTVLGAVGALVGPVGCGGDVSNNRCTAGLGTGSSAGTSGGAGSDTCPSAIGGSSVLCPQVASRYAECTATHLSSGVGSINMLLVVERSSNMNEPHPSGNGLSKWDTMRSALGTMLTRLVTSNWPIPTDYHLGLELFPFTGVPSTTGDAGAEPKDACGVPAGDSAINVPIQPGSSQLARVSDFIGAQHPEGYSPTAEALRRARDYYTKGDGRCLPGAKWVLLVSSGQSNCNPSLTCGAGLLCDDQDEVIATIQTLTQSRIDTLVIGMPSTEIDTASLNAFAIAGGPYNNSWSGELYFAIPDAYTVSDFENTVTPQILRSCDIQLKSTPVKPSATHVFMNCLPVPQSLSEQSTGWYIDLTQSPAHMMFRGDACNAMFGNFGPISSLDIYADCPGE